MGYQRKQEREKKSEKEIAQPTPPTSTIDIPLHNHPSLLAVPCYATITDLFKRLVPFGKTGKLMSHFRNLAVRSHEVYTQERLMTRLGDECAM